MKYYRKSHVYIYIFFINTETIEWMNEISQHLVCGNFHGIFMADENGI